MGSEPPQIQELRPLTDQNLLPILPAQKALARIATTLPDRHPQDLENIGGYLDIWGERVRKARLAKGWSQNDLAVRARVVPQTISRIETARIRPHLRTMEQIAWALEVDVRWLIG
jgi:ribosome-binding protein aMBF1 (putative translation factor)